MAQLLNEKEDGYLVAQHPLWDDSDFDEETTKMWEKIFLDSWLEDFGSNLTDEAKSIIAVQWINGTISLTLKLDTIRENLVKNGYDYFCIM